MAFDDEADITQLLSQVKSLFNNQNSFVQPNTKANTNIQYQAPIKGTFYNSGNFSMSATDPRHPQGHMGVDMRAAAGTSIYPLAPGVVTNVGSNTKGGNVINIQHDNNVRSYYAHLGTVKVQKGDKVDNNTIIGSVGNTGNARETFPHLHFQVWKNNQIQNPTQFFPVPPYSNLDKTKEKWWISDEAKQEAKAFNMQNHLQDRRVAFSSNINTLLKVSNTYFKLLIKN